MTLETILSDFAFLDDWEDRYRYVIELGRDLPPLPDEARTDANKVRGCVSQVWLETRIEANGAGRPAVLHFLGDSDAHIVRGLIAILFAIYSGKRVDEILAIEPDPILDRLGLREHLTPQRSNGLASMLAQIRYEAEKALETVH